MEKGKGKMEKRLRTPLIAVIGLALSAAAPIAQQKPPAAGSSTSINIPFEHYTMPNGLQVILAPDRTTPSVAVNMWYHVGSKNEEKGRTGFAHLFEHVMFTGSGNIPYGLHDKYTSGIGGDNNGTTDNDRTLYYEVVPSNYLETALWLEADRMGFLLDALDIAKLNAQRDIVKNERRQRIDNQPYGRVGEILSAAMYPPGHQYSWSVIGSMTDLSAASEEDVKNFFRLYYAPNNAILTLAGDFDPKQARTWIEKYFSAIPKGKPITRPTIAPAVLSAEKRLVFEDKVPVPRLYMQWSTVGVKHEDDYALSVLGPVLAGARTARLTKALVYDKPSAASISAFQGSSEDVGEFGITVTPRPGSTLTALEQEIDVIVERLKKGRSHRAGDPGGDRSAGAAVCQRPAVESRQDEPARRRRRLSQRSRPSLETEYEKRRAVTPDDVKRVANKYLIGNRVILSVVPVGKSDLAAKPEASQKVGGDQ